MSIHQLGLGSMYEKRQELAVMETGSGGLSLSLHVGLGKLQGDGKTKHRADARLALGSDVSSHQFNELFANR